MNIAFLASHRGSNMQAVIDACKEGRLQALPCVVISNNSGSEALVRARQEGIPGYHRSSKTHPDPEQLDTEILNLLRQHRADLIVLAGYMRKLGPMTLAEYKGRVLNIHPALLPKHGGQGMYGRAVHEAVLAGHEQETGVTIHLVDAEYDQGAIIAQTRVPVLDTDTVETLAARVLETEHRFLVETLARIGREELVLQQMFLYRPVGIKELELIAEAGYKKFPPRLPEQPIFYPVLNFEYAEQIARDWNSTSGNFAGFVTRFEVEDAYVSRFEVRIVGRRGLHEELWVPAEELEEFNRHIVGKITIEAAYYGEEFEGEVDSETNLPTCIDDWAIAN